MCLATVSRRRSAPGRLRQLPPRARSPAVPTSPPLGSVLRRRVRRSEAGIVTRDRDGSIIHDKKSGRFPALEEREGCQEWPTEAGAGLALPLPARRRAGCGGHTPLGGRPVRHTPHSGHGGPPAEPSPEDLPKGHRPLPGHRARPSPARPQQAIGTREGPPSSVASSVVPRPLSVLKRCSLLLDGQ